MGKIINTLASSLLYASLLLQPVQANAEDYLKKARVLIKQGEYADARFLLEKDGSKEAYAELAKLSIYKSFQNYPKGSSELSDFGRKITRVREEVADLLRKAQLLGYKGSLEDIFLDNEVFIKYDGKLTKSDENVIARYFTHKRFNQLEDLLERDLFNEHKQDYERYGSIFNLDNDCYIILTKMSSNQYRVLFFGKNDNSAMDFHINNGKISKRISQYAGFRAKEPKLCK